MGYQTEFEGHFTLSRKLESQHAAYLRAFAETRRMKRDANAAALYLDPVRQAAGLPIGNEGSYFVGGTSRTRGGSIMTDSSIIDQNDPPSEQPGLWCKWHPTVTDDGIEWDGCEKFYDYIEWIVYLNQHFLKPWGYVLGGSVSWQGEDISDHGTILVVNGDPTASACSYKAPVTPDTITWNEFVDILLGDDEVLRPLAVKVTEAVLLKDGIASKIALKVLCDALSNQGKP